MIDNLSALVDRVSAVQGSLGDVGFSFRHLHVLPILRYESLLAFRNGHRYTNQQVALPKQMILGRLKSLIRKEPSTSIFDNAQVLVHAPHFKSVKINGLEYNHYLDPFFDACLDRGLHVAKTAFEWRDSFPKSKQVHPIVKLEKDSWLPHFLRNNRSIIDDLMIEDLVAKWKIATGVQINKNHLSNTLFRAALAKFVFTKLLKNSRVNRILFECYYKPEVFGIIAAAKELDIQTVDIQHGKQGTHHLMYTHWSAAPEGGFNTVPDEFWNWGEESVENIRSSSSVEFLKNHKPRAVGFPWLDKCREQLPFTLDENQQGFLKRLSSFDSRILITLQPETVDNEGAIPSELLDVMLTTRENRAWLIRLHPSMKQLPNRYDSLLNIENVFIDIPTALPLYVLLKHSTHHITKFSSVAFEANSFGIPTLIIGAIGLSLYSQYFKDAVFLSNQQMSVVEFVKSNDIKIKQTNYFTTFDTRIV